LGIEGDRMKRINKIMFILLIFVTVISSMPLYSNALGDIIVDGKDFLKQGTQNVIAPKENQIKAIANTVSNILLSIAAGVTLISSVIMGINFAIQSVEEKAKIKESMIPWIIGIFISFGAYGIWKITMSVFYQI